MKYFIDFEATQFTNEIISIGCISETEKIFNSLVRPSKKKNMTTFITELTGIEKDVVMEAPTSDEVFNDFYDFIQETNNGEMIEFYCYGNVDESFVKKNLSKTNSFKAQLILSTIAMSLIDYSSAVKNHFGLFQNISLGKVLRYYYPDVDFTAHSALEDAIALKMIYEKVENESEVKGIPFPDYMKIESLTIDSCFDNLIIQRWYKGECTSFETLDEAAEFTMKIMRRKGINNANPENVKKRIIRAINGKKEYHESKWKAIFKQVGE